MVDSKLSGFNGFAVLIQVSPKKKEGVVKFSFIDCFVFYFFYLFVVFHVSIMK